MSFLTRRRLARCHSIADLREAARKCNPRVMFDYIDGAADDEITMYRNNAGFGRYDLVPHNLVDVRNIDLRTTVLGQAVEWPVLIAPTGTSRLFHHEGERAVVRAAAKFGTIYSLSSMASCNIEEVAAAADVPKWYQIYVWKDRAVVKEFIRRCRDAGYKSLCLTVDTPTVGHRERDLRNGMTVPPRLTASSMANAALHPVWLWHLLTKPRITLANVKGRPGHGVEKAATLAMTAREQMDAGVTWDDLAWMVEEWGGPFSIKGVLRPEDAVRALDAGVRGIIVSNHGGRQLDHAPAAIDVLPGIVDAVSDRGEVILDGGIRRGTDVVKALALGARACMIGRPYLYGLAAGGQAGVERALELLRSEIHLAMMLLGCTSVKALNRGYLRKRADADRETHLAGTGGMLGGSE
ncbi:MAG TPA: alpha-hydroxy acid oxidase [Gammaproteobacteria bacterium]|nr:alpha-hydroxy acid oxidase [Gammaproteobacteria bacterium]